MTIDREKLRTAILEINKRRQDRDLYCREFAALPDWKARWEYEKRYSADRATMLYSIRAHSRGRLHITKRWVPTYCENGLRKLEHWDLERQEKYIGDAWKEFEAQAEVVAV